MPDAKAAPRRVLIIVQNLPVPFDRRVWLEATTLARAGYRVSVICPKMKGFNAGHEILEDIEIRYRQRELDLIANEESRRLFALRARTVSEVDFDLYLHTV